MSPQEEERLRQIIREEFALLFSPSPSVDRQRRAQQNVEEARRKKLEKMKGKH